MKTLGKILVILFAFVLVAGLMVVAVNAVGANRPSFNSGSPEFRPHDDGEGELPFRPEGGEQGDGERDTFDGRGILFGGVKNTVVIAIVILAIAWPRSIAKNKKRTAAIS